MNMADMQHSCLLHEQDWHVAQLSVTWTRLTCDTSVYYMNKATCNTSVCEMNKADMRYKCYMNKVDMRHKHYMNKADMRHKCYMNKADMQYKCPMHFVLIKLSWLTAGH